ncbi:hypothetical protein GYB22_03525 [bacterium]|nr:hypothetical protein [bacterium]
MSSTDPYFHIVVSVALFVLIVINVTIILIINLRKQYKLLSETRRREHEVIEKERLRLANDLHDGANAIILQVTQELKADLIHANMSGEVIEHASENFTNFRNELRVLAEELYPKELVDNNWIAALEAQCKRYQNQDLSISFESEFNTPLSEEKAIQSFRIIQELLSNSIKHSQPEHISVFVEQQKGEVLVELHYCPKIKIKVNGTSSGRGSTTIKSRLKLIGGHLSSYFDPDDALTRIDQLKFKA